MEKFMKSSTAVFVCVPCKKISLVWRPLEMWSAKMMNNEKILTEEFV